MGLARLLSWGTGTAGIGYVAYRSFFTPDGLDANNYGVFRFGRAAVAVGKIAVDYKLTLSSSSSNNQELLSRCHLRSADTLLDLCRANGGCFVKVGQHIGALDYLLPQEYVDTMKVLHNRAPEMDLRDVYRVMREDLLLEPDQLFSKFDEKPLGTASLAQVHRATLRDTNEEVAVKVQHRFVKNHSFVDIHTMDFFAHVVKLVFPQFQFMWLAQEMRINLPLELSFVQEGRNSEKVANLLSHFSWLKIPKVHWDWTTDRVLVMEYVDGTHIDDVQGLRDKKVDLFSVSRKISQMYADMIFEHGYVHCDPHPGNVLVRKTAEGDDQVILLDHGLYSQLTNDFRLNYSHFWLSILNADTDGIKEYATRLGVGQLYGLFACMVAGRSWNSISEGIDRAEKTDEESKEIKENVGRYIREIANVLAFVNRQMILIFKTNDLLRTIEHNLGTQSSMAFFVTMSRACFHCLNGEQRRIARGSGALALTTVIIKSHWDQFKISLYQIFLWCWFSRLGIYTRRLVYGTNRRPRNPKSLKDTI